MPRLSRTLRGHYYLCVGILGDMCPHTAARVLLLPHNYCFTTAITTIFTTALWLTGELERRSVLVADVC